MGRRAIYGKPMSPAQRQARRRRRVRAITRAARRREVGRLTALDLFCGADGASMGLHRAGFDVIGVDLVAQPRYPFRFVQADALTMSPRGFDLIWASPPCQHYTRARHIRGNDHPDLIATVRRMLQASGAAWCIENVVHAPLIDPIMLCGASFNLKVWRHRLFETSFPIAAPPHPKHDCPACAMGRPPRESEVVHCIGNFSGVQRGREAMGIDWMTGAELAEAIPPAFAEFVARAAIAAGL